MSKTLFDVRCVYQAPESEIIFVRLEGGILQSSTHNTINSWEEDNGDNLNC